MKNGYNAYVLYLYTKTQLQYSTYECVINSLKNRGRWYEKYLKSWNSVRADRDGKLFQKLEEKYSIREIAEIFFIYWINNKDFYIIDVFENTKISCDFTECLNSLEQILKKDWKKIKQNGDLKYKIFHTTLLINTNITIFSKAILKLVFNVDYDTVTMFDLERKLYEKNMLEINKIMELYPSKFDKKYWNNYFKMVVINN